MEKRYVKLVVGVPTEYADDVRQALGQAGAGKIGHYSFCSFSTKGIGRFKPDEGANPTIGEVGKIEAVEEESIETVCPEDMVQEVIEAVRNVHPYEEIAFDVFPLIISPEAISKKDSEK